MTKKHGKKLAARGRQGQFGGRYEGHLPQVGGIGGGSEHVGRVGLSDIMRDVEDSNRVSNIEVERAIRQLTELRNPPSMRSPG